MHWTVHLEGGPRRVNHAAVVIGEKIYSFGGYCSGDDFEIRKPIDIHVLDTVTLRWKYLPVPQPSDPQYHLTPYHRYGHTVVAYNNKAYLFGGRNDVDGACNQLFQFDPSRLTWTIIDTEGHQPPARDGHTACVIGRRMYVFGGFEEEFHRFSNEVFILNLDTFQWVELIQRGVQPLWRDFHTATTIDHRMFVFGGRSDVTGQFHSSREVYDDRLLVLDTRTGAWSEPAVTGEAPVGRRSHSSFVHNGLIYIFGGYNGVLDRHFNSLHQFDPKTLKWTEVNPFGIGPKPRRRQCCVMVDSKLYLFGGTSPKEPRSEVSHPPEVWADEPDLTDHSDLFILDFAADLKTLSILALLKYCRGDVGSILPQLPIVLQWEIVAMVKHNKISSSIRSDNSSG